VRNNSGVVKTRLWKFIHLFCSFFRKKKFPQVKKGILEKDHSIKFFFEPRRRVHLLIVKKRREEFSDLFLLSPTFSKKIRKNPDVEGTKKYEEDLRDGA
jgi:hypothetical protein